MPATRVHQLDHPVTQVEGERGGERAGGHHHLGGHQLGVPLVPVGLLRRPGTGLRGVRRQRCRCVLVRDELGAVSAASTPLPKVWSKCTWVFTAASSGALDSLRRSASTVRAARSEALVSTTRSPAAPATTLTLTSNQS